MNKIRKIIFVIILFLEIIQAYFMINSTIIYEGVHNITSFLVVCLIIGFSWYRVLLKNSFPNHKKIKLVILIVITIGVPVVLFSTQPEFTYEEGKLLIVEEYKEYQNLEFTEYNGKMNTIPVINNSKEFLVENRNYYYSINIDGDYIYFHVNPINGEVYRLNEGYWPEDMRW